MNSVRSYTFSNRHFERVRVLVRDLMGITLADSKTELVYGRLFKRLQSLGMTGFDDYCNLIEAGDTQETEHFINALTTNKTSFFRESHHFSYLTDTLLPELVGAAPTQRHLRIWSAGCSTGEEPYSIAMTLLEQNIQRPSWDVRILATDIDSKVLATAKAGVYDAERASDLDNRWRRWMLKGRGQQIGHARMRPELQKLIVFKQLNLMHAWPFHGPFNCIFCRNVVIYFDKTTQAVLFDRFADMLPMGGHLFIGHSESLHKVTRRFELVGQSIYRRAA